MPDSNYTIGLKITSTSDDAGLERTTSGLERLHAEAQRGGGIWDGLGKKVLGFIAAFVGIQKVIGWLKDAFREAVEAESSFVRLGNTMLAFDPQAKRTAESVGEWAKALAKLTGVNDELTQGIISRFLPVLKNTEAAMHLAQLAALAQQRGWTDAASAADLLGNAIMGKPVRGTDMLSRLLYEGALSGEDFAVTLGKVETALATTATKTETMALRLARLKEEQNETKEAIGTQFANALLGLAPAFELFLKFIGHMAAGVLKLTGFVIGNAKAISQWAQSLVFAVSGNFLAAIEAAGRAGEVAGKTFADYDERATKMLTDILSAFQKDTSAIDAIGTKAEQEAIKHIQAVYARLKAEREREARERKAQEERERLAKAAVDAAEAGIKYREAVEEAKRIGTARLHVEQDLNAKMLASLRLYEGRVLQVKKLAQANVKQMNTQELADYIAKLRAELAAETATMQERNALTLQLARAEYEIKKKGGEMVVQASLAAGQQIFAGNKEVSAALSIMSAFTAAAGAAAETHGDVYTRIAAYIAAFAQVWAAVVGIGDTELGGGGGAGAGSYAGAGVGPPRVYTGGAGMAGATAPRGPTSTTNVTTNAPTTTVINVNALDTTQALRSAQRALRPAGRSYDRTLIGRGAVVVGTRRPR